MPRNTLAGETILIRCVVLGAALMLQACADGGSPLVQVPGTPRLSVPTAQLQDSLKCSVDPATAQRTPLLLVPGTTLTPEANYDWNYPPALDALGWPYCTVELPERAMGDIQIAAEHVVFAIREVSRRSGRQVQILGYSQGGMVPRWALRFWPDTRDLVPDLVSLSGSHHGTVLARPNCVPDCAAAFWQQDANANFIAALNAGDLETWPQVWYTSIYTRFDEVVVPNLAPGAASSELRGGDNVVNVATQDVCPTNTAEHLAIGSYDPVAYALAIDALANTGPADPTRISLAVCAEAFMPGVNPQTFAADFAAYVGFIGDTIENAERVPEEPPLKCYVDDTCPD